MLEIPTKKQTHLTIHDQIWPNMKPRSCYDDTFSRSRLGLLVTPAAIQTTMSDRSASNLVLPPAWSDR
jgi:hypothetical protein